ncbi:hypothetical protein BDV96DRAFT_316753 [Lophiotrema nucula]|uniref:Ecp2 effector protein domain-containing protein n=1 Tax=Lophiotrema nucula TaxID=690887 RepID=A0A6A5ZLF5_9PLEO|nr:hypothetical protein BDV96DRAFT_316753 [Lophiotrema nucula]
MTVLKLLALLTSSALLSTALPTTQNPQNPDFFHIIICTAPNHLDCVSLAIAPSPRGGKRNCGNMLDKFNDSITSLYPVEREAEWWIYADPDCGGKRMNITMFGLDDLRYAEFNDMVSSLAVWPRETTAEDMGGVGRMDPGN